MTNNFLLLGPKFYFTFLLSLFLEVTEQDLESPLSADGYVYQLYPCFPCNDL